MKPNRESQSGQLQRFLRMVIAAGYILLAIFVVFKKWLMVPLSTMGAYLLGALLFIYGAYRFYRATDKN